MTAAAPPSLDQIPAVGRLLETPEFRVLVSRHGHGPVKAALRAETGTIRRAMRAGIPEAIPPLFRRVPGEHLLLAVGERLRDARGAGLRRVLNATGVIVHTNLGRAPVSRRAGVAMFEAATSYTDLEFDLDTGGRGSRHDHVASLFEGMFPGRAAMVVGNAAGAVLLALDTLARGRKVVVSRGELVEIGGSFRVPEIMERSGARLVEVGTTNRTRIEDYRRALEAEADPSATTGALLRVHPSNFRVVGFTESASTRDLARLGAEFGIPVIEDFGSGNTFHLRDFGATGEEEEPTLAECVAAGPDLVIFSGDKLLGGPQAGILLGTPEAIARCRKNPLARALRADKTAIAGLLETLWSHASGRARDEVPVVRALARPLSEVERDAERLRDRLRPPAGWTADVIPEVSRVGGGAAPDAGIPTHCLALAREGDSAEAIRRRLLAGDPPVAVRVRDERILLDPRTLLEDELDELEIVLRELVATIPGQR